MIFAEILVYGAFAYLAFGAVFALWFVTRRIGKFDPAAVGTGIGFRAIIFFGTTALWIVVVAMLFRRNDAEH